MPWGKMDDKFHRNRKVRQLRRIEGGREALGVWTYWWSWCLDDPELTGIVPRDELPEADLQAAKLLVDVELWDVVDDGYQFHDFNDYNPTRDQVESKKTADRERMAAKRSHASRENVASDSHANPSGRPTRVASTRDPVPSRPDPDLSTENNSHLSIPDTNHAQARTGFDSSDLERLFSQLRAQTPGGGKFKAQRSDYLRAQSAVEWAHSESPANPLSAARESIAKFLVHARGREADGWPFWAWANDPGRWFAYVPGVSGNQEAHSAGNRHAAETSKVTSRARLEQAAKESNQDWVAEAQAELEREFAGASGAGK